MIVNANSIVQHAIQIKNEIMINANASIKSIVSAPKIVVGILKHMYLPERWASKKYFQYFSNCVW